MNVTTYHNTRCSKSRRALELLRSRGIEPRIVECLQTPPSSEELEEILELLGLEPRDPMRKKEAPYRELGLGDDGLDRQALVAAMVEHPVLMERPIVLANGRAALGIPPEKFLEIL